MHCNKYVPLTVPLQQLFEAGVVNRLRQQWLRIPHSTFDGDAKLSLSYETVLFPFLGGFSVDLFKVIIFNFFENPSASNFKVNLKLRLTQNIVETLTDCIGGNRLGGILGHLRISAFSN